MHLALPQTMTPENLGAWIETNNIEKKNHEERFDLTAAEISAFEHNSSVASRAIDKLNGQLDYFKTLLKEGVQETVTVKVEPTQGLKVLQANREYADEQIERGYRTENTELYGIPYAGTKKICFFDIEGSHFEQYDYKMNPFQVEKYGQPLFEGKTVGFNTGLPGKFVGGDGSKESPMTFQVDEKELKKSRKYVAPVKDEDEEESDDQPFI